VGTVAKYDYSDPEAMKELTATDPGYTDPKKLKEGVEPQFTQTSATSKTCDNFVLEYDLKITYKSVTGKSTPTFEIAAAAVDLVYGTLTMKQDDDVSISRVASVSFEQSTSSRKSSGAPGYIKGKALRAGTKVSPVGSPPSAPYISELVDGFYLRGADNTGKCISLPPPPPDSKSAAYAKLLRTWTQNVPYTEDPPLTFDDSILYGCHLDLTYEELKSFCEQKDYLRLVLFQNLKYSLGEIGRFGNANPHYIKDWIAVQKTEATGGNQGGPGKLEDDGTCKSMPSAAFVRVFYQKIGRADNHQHEIIKADFKWTGDYNPWKFNKPKKTLT